MDKNLLRRLAGIPSISTSQLNKSKSQKLKENKDSEDSKKDEMDTEMPVDTGSEMDIDMDAGAQTDTDTGEEKDADLPEIIKDLAAQAKDKSGEELEDLMIQIYKAGVNDGEEKQEKVTEMYVYDKMQRMSPEERAAFNKRRNASKDTLANRPVGGLIKHAAELKSYMRGKGTTSDTRRSDRRGLDNYERNYTAKYSGPMGRLPEEIELNEMFYYDDKVSNKERARQAKMGSIKVINTPSFKVVRLNTKEAAQLYGAGTTWDIATKGTTNTFDKYHAKGNIHIIIAKIDGKMKKFLYQGISNTFIDEAGIKVSKATYDKLKEIPQYQDFLNIVNAPRWSTMNARYD